MHVGGKFALAVLSIFLLAGMGCASQRPIDNAYSEDRPVLWDPASGNPAEAAVTFVARVTHAPADRLVVLSYNMQHRNRPQELAAFADTLREVEGPPP